MPDTSYMEKYRTHHLLILVRKNLQSFLAILFAGLFMVGCGTQVQTTSTNIPTPEQTATLRPSATLPPTSTLTPIPTRTPLPTFIHPPTPTLGPLAEGIFDPFPETFYDNTVKMTFGTIISGTTVEEPVLVDSTIGKMWFSVYWRQGDLDLTLLGPDGVLIDPSVAEADELIAFTSDSASEEYRIYAPLDGEWTVSIFGKSTSPSGSNYMLEAKAVAATIISVNFDREVYSPGDPIKLTAGIEDSRSAAPLVPEYIHQVTMKVKVEDPAKNRSTFELYDDGLHGDGEADDGLYGNTFGNTTLPGSYNFYIEISGFNNRGAAGMYGIEPSPFTRIWFLSAYVK